MKNTTNFPSGWDEERVQRVLHHYDSLNEDETVAEDEAAFEDSTQIVMDIPNKLVPTCGHCLQAVLGSLNFPVPTTDCKWPIIAAGRFSGSGSGRRGKVLGTTVLNQRCVGSSMSLAWELGI